MAEQKEIDISKLSEEERKFYDRYGRLPSSKSVAQKKLQERKYFDSGDYALSKVGKTTAPVGSSHPIPENIPHSNPQQSGAPGTSPVKVESALARQPQNP